MQYTNKSENTTLDSKLCQNNTSAAAASITVCDIKQVSSSASSSASSLCGLSTGRCYRSYDNTQMDVGTVPNK